MSSRDQVNDDTATWWGHCRATGRHLYTGNKVKLCVLPDNKLDLQDVPSGESSLRTRANYPRWVRETYRVFLEDPGGSGCL